MADANGSADIANSSANGSAGSADSADGANSSADGAVTDFATSACAQFAELYRAWVASFRSNPELAEVHEALHRYVEVRLPPGLKTRAEARLEAEFNMLTRRLPYLIDNQGRSPEFAHMAEALRALPAALCALAARVPPARVPPAGALPAALCALAARNPPAGALPAALCALAARNPPAGVPPARVPPARKLPARLPPASADEMRSRIAAYGLSDCWDGASAAFDTHSCVQDGCDACCYLLDAVSQRVCAATKK